MATPVVQKLWNYCNILRDDGLSYGDYVEQLTFCCSSRWRMSKSVAVQQKVADSGDVSWPEVLKRDGDELEIHYRHTLDELGKEPSSFARSETNPQVRAGLAEAKLGPLIAR